MYTSTPPIYLDGAGRENITSFASIIITLFYAPICMTAGPSDRVGLRRGSAAVRLVESHRRHGCLYSVTCVAR